MNGTLRIGCAITTESVVAVVIGRTQAEARVDVAPPGGPLHERIATAFAGAVSELVENAAGARVRVAVLPPLARVRNVALPPMSAEESSRVLTRNAGKYFFGVREPQIAAVVRGAGRAADLLVSVVPASLIDALRSATPEGVTVECVAMAAAAWAAHARAGDSVDAVIDNVRYSFDVKSGRPSSVRRYRGPHPEPHVPPDQPLAAAAANVWRTDHLTFLTPVDWQERHRRRRRSIRAALAVAVLVIAAGIAGMHAMLSYELNDIRAQRAALREPLGPVLAAADSLQRIEDRLTAMDAYRGGMRWSDVIPMIAQRLDDDAHLVRLAGSSDSLAFRVIAGAAADALPELRGAPLLRDVRIVGAIQRDVTDETVATEQFDIAARIREPEQRQ